MNIVHNFYVHTDISLNEYFTFQQAMKQEDECYLLKLWKKRSILTRKEGIGRLFIDSQYQ